MTLADEEVLKSRSHWTELRSKVRDIIAGKFPTYKVEVDGDAILISSDRPLVLVEQIGNGTYRTKTNASGSPGDPRTIVGGGLNVSADDLLRQIGRDIGLIEGRRN